MNRASSYRADIDGLRALAVLLVIGFHAFPGLIPGGYVGVDIFFVISGFLITGLLLHDLKHKQFSFAGFYARRIRRIFPALVTVLVVCLAAGWLLLLPREFASLGLGVFGGAAFSSNLVLLSQTGYFDVSAVQKPLLHLWSLGVEEQFYIVWPILLLLAFSRRLSIVILALALFAASFAWNLGDIGATSDFYLPFTRAWELMIGAAMAAVAGGMEKFDLGRLGYSTRSVLANTVPVAWAAGLSRRDLWTGVGLGLIAVAVFALRRDSSFPGWWALLPTAGAALIIAADGAWLNRTILANRAIVLIGLISYPLYLWHWPLLSFATIADPSGTSAGIRLAAIVGSAALAFATYRWIELPIRMGQRRPLKAGCLSIAMLATGLLGLSAFHYKGFPFRIPSAIRELASVEDASLDAWRSGSCFLNEGQVKFAPSCVEHGPRPLLFLWGDSLAGSLYSGLKELQQSRTFSIAQFTKSGCVPLPSFPVPGRRHCVETNDEAFAALSASHPDIVLLYSKWNYGDLIDPLRDLLSKLRLLKIPRVIIMGPAPQWDGGLPKAVRDYYMSDPMRRLIPVRSNFRVSQDWYRFARLFARREVPPGVEYISTWDTLCKADECVTRVGDKASDLIYFDNAHLTVAGSNFLARAIAPCLFAERDKPPALGAPDGINPSAVCYRTGEPEYDEKPSSELPQPQTGGYKWIAANDLKVESVSGPPALGGQPVMRLVATEVDGNHSIAAKFAGLDKNQLYRITAWVKSEEGANTRLMLHDNGAGIGPINGGVVSFDLTYHKPISIGGDVTAQQTGVIQDQSGWQKIWADLKTADGRLVVNLGVVLGSSPRFKGDGKLAIVVGGLEARAIAPCLVAEHDKVSAPGAPSDFNPSAGCGRTVGQQYDEEPLSDVPQPQTGGYKWIAATDLKVESASGPPAYDGQPVLRLVPAAVNGDHTIAAKFTGLDKNRVYRITAWVKSEEGANIRLMLHNNGVGVGSTGAGGVMFDLANRKTIAVGGDVAARQTGITQDQSGWRKIWAEMKTTDGQLVVNLDVVLGGSPSFKGDGKLAIVVGGLEARPRS